MAKQILIILQFSKKNEAQIGGGLRILNLFLNQNPQELIQLMKKIKFNYNLAYLFGQNYQLGLQIIKVEDIFTQEKLQKIEFVYNDSRSFQQSKYSGKLSINNFKSGDAIRIEISIIDEEGNKFNISQYQFQNKLMHSSIQNELSQYTFKLESMDQETLQLNGQIIIKLDSFDFNSNSFIFNKLSIISQLQSSKQLYITYKIYSFIQLPILIEIQFRNCVQGEILKHYIYQIYSCEACEYGTYSLQKYNNFNYTSYSNENQICQIFKKCPKQANFCQANIIQLQVGYWRESILEDALDLIQHCQNSPQNCQEQYPNQIKGCIDGYIGPLCETCDSLGKIWKQKYTKQFSSKFNCQLCNKLVFQILITVVISFFIIIYGSSSTIIYSIQNIKCDKNVNTTDLQELLERLFYLLFENFNKLPINNSIHNKIGAKQLISKRLHQHRYFLEPITSAPKFSGLPDKLSY
ncbi:hypothetical protein ABPG72_021316 [Tetrahymena utriculariae]